MLNKIIDLHNDNFLQECDSCLATSSYIICKIYDKSESDKIYTFDIPDSINFHNILEQLKDNQIYNINLFRRSHSINIFKDNNDYYIVSSYQNKYKSRITKINKSLKNFSLDLINIEFYDDKVLHTEYFNVEEMPLYKTDIQTFKPKIMIHLYM